MSEVRLARILAYVDGELSPSERTAFQAEIAADPALATEVSAHDALSARVAGAYAPVLDEPVPIGLTLAAAAANDRGHTRFAPWAAAAACLFVGVLAGRLAAPAPGPLATSASIERALTRALAAEGGTVRVGFTFRDHAGRWCRTFESAPDRLAGLACRVDGSWRLHVAAAWTPEVRQYRQAGGGVPAPILAAVDQLRASDVLGPAEERAARDRGWREAP